MKKVIILDCWKKILKCLNLWKKKCGEKIVFKALHLGEIDDFSFFASDGRITHLTYHSREFPVEVLKLRNLKRLILADGMFKEIPEEITNLTSLEYLYIQYGQL